MQNIRRFGDHSFYDKFGKNGWPVYRECHVDYQRGLRLFLLIFVKLLKTFYMSTLFLNFLWHIMQTIFEESVVKHGQPFVNSELRMSSLDHGLELSIKVLGFLFYGRLLQYCTFEQLLVVRDKNFLLVAILIIEHFSVKFLCVIFCGQVVLQPFEVTYDSSFLFGIMDFHHVLSSVQFQHERVIFIIFCLLLWP